MDRLTRRKSTGKSSLTGQRSAYRVEDHVRPLPAGGRLQPVAPTLGIGVELGLGPAQVHGQRDELLLRAVVQVAFDAPPLGVARLQDACP